ncbi:MAG: hypothetical protein IJ347_03240, partial [Faecalibacterium sp.]|nr:hypothetical protein [Faecalibacterium sp.]
MKKRTKKLLNRGVTAKKGKAQGARGGAAMAEQNSLFRNVFSRLLSAHFCPKPIPAGSGFFLLGFQEKAIRRSGQ